MKRMFFVVAITSLLVTQSGWSAEKSRAVASAGINTMDPNLKSEVCGVRSGTGLDEATFANGQQRSATSQDHTL